MRDSPRRTTGLEVPTPHATAARELQPQQPAPLLLALVARSQLQQRCRGLIDGDDAPKPGETPDVPAQIVPKTRKFKRTRWHDIVSDVFKDSQYASRTFKDKMVVAKRLYAQEKREGRVVDRNRVEREDAQARSTERMAALNRVGSMRRKPPQLNEFQQRAALAAAGIPTSFTSR